MTADPILDSASAPSQSPRRRLWKTAWILIGSAAFSGVALVVWNRRELARIQQSVPPSSMPLAESEDEEIF